MIHFYGEELLAPPPIPKLEDQPLLAVSDCILNIFAATLHIGGRSSIPKPEDAPCRGYRDPLIVDHQGYKIQSLDTLKAYSETIKV